MVARVVGLLPEKYVLNIYEFNPVVLDLKTFIEFRGVVLMRKLKEFQKKTRVSKAFFWKANIKRNEVVGNAVRKTNTALHFRVYDCKVVMSKDQMLALLPVECCYRRLQLTQQKFLTEKLENLESFKEATVLNGRRCPHCQEYCQRLDGCDHMTCACGKKFRFRCYQNYGSSFLHYKCKILKLEIIPTQLDFIKPVRVIAKSVWSIRE
ncbi:unnamed protein product [Enterobius vermicularis]|uniref:MYND-type domain-containing protein n=1 Tax=Enterobius vermicularis TaxID=51028 RepID=A0A0N4V627_ENTVE|nr:unnamed protein product [Enterobius vermicularis]